MSDIGPSTRGADTPAGAPLIELVGVAGAGKTTLLRTLKQRDARLRTDVSIGRMRRLDLLARHTLRFLPALVRSAPRGRWFTWHELRLMAYLEGWPRGAFGQRTRPTLFDHGPIFILVQLREFGPPLVAGPAFEAWWRAARSAWARAIDLVVWLEAPDDVLLPRIDARAQRHPVKHKPIAMAAEFLASYRRGYEKLLAEMAAEGHFRVVRFDTSRVSLEEVAEGVLDAIRREGLVS
jgi:shikimate kinase